MSHYRMSILEETGYAVLDSYGGVVDPSEWMSLEYVDWKSSGDTRFAPLASAQGELEEALSRVVKSAAWRAADLEVEGDAGTGRGNSS